MIFKRVLALFTFILFSTPLLGSSASAAANPIPAPVGDIYVQDFANVLSPQEKDELIRYGKSIDDKTTNQIAVLTVNSLGGMDIDEFANKAYRSYGLGTKEKDNGVLLVLAMKDKKVRIEVGYGLEGVITDGKAGSILDQYTLPYLKAGQPNLAVIHTYQAIANEVTGKNQESKIEPEKQQQHQGTSIPSWLIIVLVIGFLIIDFKFFGGTLSFALLSILGRGGGGRGGGGGGPRSGGGGSSGGGGAGRGW